MNHGLVRVLGAAWLFALLGVGTLAILAGGLA